MILKQKQNNCFSSFWNPPNYVSPPTYKHTLMEVVIVAFSPLFLFFFLSFFPRSIFIPFFYYDYQVLASLLYDKEHREIFRSRANDKQKRENKRWNGSFLFFSFLFRVISFPTNNNFSLPVRQHTQQMKRDLRTHARPLSFSRFLSSCWTT